MTDSSSGDRSSPHYNLRQNLTQVRRGGAGPSEVVSVPRNQVNVATARDLGWTPVARVEPVPPVPAAPVPMAAQAGGANAAAAPVQQPPPAEAPQLQLQPKRTKVKYEYFEGRSRDDGEAWIDSFKGAAASNGEDIEADLCSLFQGLLKRDARRWYKGLSAETRQRWALLEAAFLARYKDEGAEARYETMLRTVYLKETQSVKAYGEKVRSIVSRMNAAPGPKEGHKDFIDGLPKKMRMFVLQKSTKTLTDAIKAAETFENSRIDYRGSRQDRQEPKKKKPSDSTEASSSSETSSSDSSLDGAYYSRKKSKSKSKDSKAEKKLEKLAEQMEQERGQMKESIKEMNESKEEIKKIAVNLAAQPQQRKVAGERSQMFCHICGRNNHYPKDCKYRTAPVQFMETAPPQQQVYSVQQQAQMGLHPHVYPVQSAMPSASINSPAQVNSLQAQQVPRFQAPAQSGGNQSQQQPRQRFCYECKSPDHLRNQCPLVPKLPCKRCGELGHNSVNCLAPAPKPRNEASVQWLESSPSEEEVWLTRSQARRLKARGHHSLSSTSEEETTKRNNKGAARKSPELQPASQPAAVQSVPDLPVPRIQEEVVEDGYTPVLNEPYPHDIIAEMAAVLDEETAAQAAEKAARSKEIEKTSVAEPAKAQLKEASSKDSTPQVHSKPLLHSSKFDILKVVSDLKVDISVKDLVADNPAYKKQLKPLLASRRRKLRLPSVNYLRSLNEPLLVDLIVEGCVCTNVPLDTGSDVNIMTEETARVLGFTNLEQSVSILKPVDQTRVVPLGDLHAISFFLTDQVFKQDFVVISIPSPAPFPMLMGRPFMYAAKMIPNFITREVTFGNPRKTISWSKTVYHGETSSTDPGYTSGEEDNRTTTKVSWAKPVSSSINYLEVFVAPERRKTSSSNSLTKNPSVKIRSCEGMVENPSSKIRSCKRPANFPSLKSVIEFPSLEKPGCKNVISSQTASNGQLTAGGKLVSNRKRTASSLGEGSSHSRTQNVQ